ncbi:MAG TPA: ABC transporter ATP-binding protein [Ktedonobacteraceae bacterium]|nr:ABC transporter ATP-binding protein [Ktedonobacteraceae bacterium]
MQPTPDMNPSGMIMMGSLPQKKEEEKFRFAKIPSMLASLPRVLRLIWSTNPWLTIMLGVMDLLQGMLPAITVSITALVIDNVVRAIRLGNPSPIWLPIGLQLGMSLLSSLINTFSNVTQSLLQEQVANRVQLEVLRHASLLDLAYFENPESYDKIRQATNQASSQPTNMISQIFGQVQSLVTLASLLFLLLHLAWWLALIALLTPIPAFAFNARFGWKGYRLMRQQSPERRLMAYFSMLLTTDTYNKEIKLFALSDFLIKKFWDLATKLYHQDKKQAQSRSLTSFGWSNLITLGNAGTYIYVALQAIAGRITLGGLTLYTQTAALVGPHFQNFLNGLSNTYETALYVNLYFDFLAYQPQIVSAPNPASFEDSPGSSGLEIEFHHVSFTYPGKDSATRAALRDVSFTIHAGEVVALVGSNGAGKTTLVKLLSRLYDPDEGEILLNGKNIKEFDLKDLRQQMGVIFQDYVNYFLTARENIGVGLIDEVENHELVVAAARKSGADGVIERLPQQYETTLGRWFKSLQESTQLSGGEWQKIALARAFMRNAPVLILDEPTSALDAQAEYEVFKRFRALTAQKTALFISHRFSTVRLADRIFVLEQGQIIESGSHEELLKLEKRYAELFHYQAEAYR